MSWKKLRVAAQGTHHELDGLPAYADRFDEVLTFHAPGLAPVRRDKLAWHIYQDGSAAYDRRFIRTFGYYEGLAAVSSEDGWFHITPEGTDTYSKRYDWCGNLQDGCCTVRNTSGHYFHILPDGSEAYSQRWRYAGDYRDGICVVQDNSGRSTHLNKAGETIHNRWFLNLDVFHKGFARAQDEDGWMHINALGYPIYARRFAAVEPFYNGQARVERYDGGLETIDESGRSIVELRPAQRSEFAALSADMVGFWRTQTISAAVELGVIDTLPGTVEEIAHRCHLVPERTQRFLRALGELSLVSHTDDIWTRTQRGDYLSTQHPMTLADAAREYAHEFSRLWDGLSEALRCNGSWQSPSIFWDVAMDDARCTSHHRMLASYARHDYTDISTVLRLTGNERLIDAGGGVGYLSDILLHSQPELQVTLFDLPSVIECARQLFAQREGLNYRAGNLFDPWGIKADAVMLARVLHDWSDIDARRILLRARESLRVGGQLFVVEMLLQEEGLFGGLCDLHLLMATGGQERTENEYVHLMEETGFRYQEIRHLNTLPSVLVGVAI